MVEFVSFEDDTRNFLKIGVVCPKKKAKHLPFEHGFSMVKYC